MKQKIKNGMKVKIKKSDIKYNWSSTVRKIYKEQETCRVINAHIELDRSKQLPAEHWVYDLQTKNDGKSFGFGIEELRRTII